MELFLDAHDRPPKEIVLDLDATDDPLHGHQEGRFFHGYYDCYCYLPLYVFCGRHLLAAKLRRANIDASAARVVWGVGSSARRRGWEALMAWCEENRVDYLFGLARTSRLVEHIHIELAWAEHDAEASGRPARRFADFRWTTKLSWSRRRRVVAKAEWMPGRGAKGANPRFVVTSLKPARADARTLYEQMYCARGEMENRIKECQLDLFADRTSAATVRANQLRLWFASMAYVLVTAGAMPASSAAHPGRRRRGRLRGRRRRAGGPHRRQRDRCGHRLRGERCVHLRRNWRRSSVARQRRRITIVRGNTTAGGGFAFEVPSRTALACSRGTTRRQTSFFDPSCGKRLGPGRATA